MNIAILTKKLVVRPKKIPLSQGKFALVDPEDYEYLSQFKWFAFTTRWHENSEYTIFYAARTIYPPRACDYNLRMHQAILGAPMPGFTIDHIDHNGLNNCRSNLRICTLGENNANSRAYNLKNGKRNTTLRGVYKYTRGNKWYSTIRHNGTLLRLGSFASEEEAAIAYDKKAIELKGRYAQINSIGKGGQR